MCSAHNHVSDIKINTQGSGVQVKVGGTKPQRDKASDDRRTTRLCVCSASRAVSHPKSMGSINFTHESWRTIDPIKNSKK